jgi:hypothetical protein
MTQYDDYNYGYLSRNTDFCLQQITLDYEFPLLKKPRKVALSKAIPITEVWKTDDFHQGVHFYVHDKYFSKYLDPKKLGKLTQQLKKFDFVIAPDFSLLGDAPEQNRLMNISRNMRMASYLQENSVNIIPNIRCLGPTSYHYAFLGIPKHATIALSSYGQVKNRDERRRFEEDFHEAMRQLEPEKVVVYGNLANELHFFYPDIEFIVIENFTKTRIKKTIALREQNDGKCEKLDNQSRNNCTTNPTNLEVQNGSNE